MSPSITQLWLSLTLVLVSAPLFAQFSSLNEEAETGEQVDQQGDRQVLQYLEQSHQALTNGDPQQALFSARQATRANPTVGHAATARALAALRAWPQAQTAAETAYQLLPTQEHALLLAWILSNQDRFDAAIQVLSDSLSDSNTENSTPNSVPAVVVRELALLHLANDNSQGALDALGRLPEDLVDPGVLGLALAGQPDRHREAATALTAALDSTTKNSDEDLAAQVERSNLTRRIRIELGRVLLALDRTDEGVLHLQRAYELGPQTPELAYELSTAYRKLGQRQDASAMLEEFQRLRSEEDQRDADFRSVGAELNAVQQLAAGNELAAAQERLGTLLEQHPDSYSALALQAKILFSIGKTGDALRSIRKALDLSGGVVEFNYLEGLFLRTLGRNEEAKQAFLRTLALDPEQVESHAILGGILLQEGNAEESLYHLDRAIALGADGEQIERARELARAQTSGGRGAP